MEDFGKAKQAWFKTFLRLRNGIPSHDTFNRVFAALEPKQFLERFLALNLLKREKTKKRGLRGKMLNASWDHPYLLRLLGAQFKEN